MYKIMVSLVCMFIIFLEASCKKDNQPILANTATLNIINALPTSTGLIANINEQLPYYLGQPAVGYGGSSRYSFAGGNTNILLRDNIDTATNVFTQDISFGANSIHSLFIIGNSGNVESLLITDTLPYHGAQEHGLSDSVVGIRFINLSAVSSPVNVNIIGNASGSEVSGLAYKGITGFKNYPATAAIDSYTFEFRDPISNNILASHTLYGVNDGVNGNGSPNNILFKNITIALIGESGSQSTAQINNY